MRNFSEDVKIINLVSPQAITSTLTGSTSDVEVYENDALIVADYGTIGASGSVIVTVVGSLVTTPTVYDQTLTTFVSATSSNTVAAGRANLSNIKYLRAVATLPGSTSVAVSVVAVVRPNVKSVSNTSLTAA